MELKPIKTRKIYEDIVEQIKKLITSGELKPGDRLPSERDLAVQLQVSRASVREALSALQLLGLMESRSGEGTYIREINVESLVAPFAWALFIEKDAVFELLEVRQIFEVQAAALAAERADLEDYLELEESLQTMYQDLQTGELGEHADHLFHLAIARATHNKILIQLMDVLSETMEQALTTSRLKLYQGKDIPQKLYEEHVSIYQAIQFRDVLQAQKLMSSHLAGVRENLKKGSL